MKIIIFIGPSAAGKTTMEQFLIKNRDYKKVITSTTRPQGKGEIAGNDYYFISDEEFLRLKDAGKFAEYDYNYGKSYGITKDQFAKGDNLVSVLNLSGAKSVREIYPKSTYFIFVQPPSKEELRKRLIERGRDTEPGAIEKRLANSEHEIKTWKPECDYHVLADDVNIAYEQLEKIVEKIENEK